MSQFYPRGLQAIAEAYFTGTAPSNVELYCVGVTADYVFSGNHQLIAELGGNICMEEVQIQNLTFTNGVVSGDDIRFIRPLAGPQTAALIIYAKFDGGSQLLAYLGDGAVGTIPHLLNGTDVIIRWHENGILKI